MDLKKFSWEAKCKSQLHKNSCQEKVINIGPGHLVELKYYFSRQSHLCTVLSGWTNGLNVVRIGILDMSRILILYPADATHLTAPVVLVSIRCVAFSCSKHGASQSALDDKVFQPELYKVGFVMSHIGSFLIIVAWYNVEEFPD